MGIFDKLRQGLTKTRNTMDAQLTGIFASYEPGDEDFFEDLEECLILADTGIETTERAIDELRRAIGQKKLRTGAEVKQEFVRILVKILKVRPTPFCVMDEIEAALDEANVARFAAYMRTISKNTQFLVITHRRGTMEEADMLYGVTMQEKGVSTVIELDLDQAQKTIEE